MHRTVSRWQHNEVPECGPDLAGLLELTPVGNHQLLMRRRFSSPYDLWQVTPDGLIGATPTPVGVVEEGRTAAFTLLPTDPPRILSYDPRSPDWSLYLFTSDGLVSPQVGSWPQGAVFASGRGQPWGRQFIGLEDGHLLDRNPGDGSARVWRFVPVPGSDGIVQVELRSDLAAAPRDALRRGHRLVPLGPGRLLEWLPRPSSDAGSSGGADFHVWSYSLQSGGSGSSSSIRNRSPREAGPISAPGTRSSATGVTCSCGPGRRGDCDRSPWIRPPRIPSASPHWTMSSRPSS